MPEQAPAQDAGQTVSNQTAAPVQDLGGSVSSSVTAPAQGSDLPQDVQTNATQTDTSTVTAPVDTPVEHVADQTLGLPSNDPANTNATTLQHPSFFGGEGDLLHTSLVTAGYLCLLLGVILLLYFLLRKFGPSTMRKGSGHLSPSLKGRLMLGNKQSVAVVKVLGRIMVLGVTEHQITLLDKRSVQECMDMDEEEQEHAFTKFAEMLGKSDGKTDRG